MEKELKDLLLQDLCSRLPYGVKAQYYGEEEECKCIDVIDGIYPFDNEISIGQYALKVEAIKPYLFPLSSMTEEQIKELNDKLIELELKALSNEIDHSEVAEFEIDFYNKHHIDYGNRRLIEKGLAIDATGLNIY